MSAETIDAYRAITMYGFGKEPEGYKLVPSDRLKGLLECEEELRLIKQNSKFCLSDFVESAKYDELSARYNEACRGHHEMQKQRNELRESNDQMRSIIIRIRGSAAEIA